MASQGPNSVGTGVNTNIGNTDWTNPANITTSNNSYASVALGFNQTSDELWATNFGFAIPSGATIDGIIVEVECLGNDFEDSAIQIIRGGVLAGSPKQLYSWGGETYLTYGNSSDLWGTGWTDSIINASNFGVSIRVHCNSFKGSVARVDHVRITVHYTASGGGPESASSLLVAGD